MPFANSIVSHLALLTLVGVGSSACAPTRAQEVPTPAAGPARRLPGRYFGFEPGVAADPEGRVLIAAMDKQHASRLIAWRSSDRGVTWSEPGSMGNDRDMWDVWLQADPRGGFLAAHCQRFPAPTPHDESQVVFRRSDDGGQTWEGTQILGPKKTDKPVLAVSPSGSRLAVVFYEEKRAPALQRSNDRGEHWEAIPRTGLRGWFYIPDGLGVNDKGAIVAAWEQVEASPFIEERHFRLVISATKDAGKTWNDLELGSYTPTQLEPGMREGTGAHGLNVAVALDGSGAAHALYCYPAGDQKDYRLLYRRSTDLQAWSDPVPLSSGDPGEFKGFPAVAAAGDRVHVAWMERSGGLFNVWYRGSTDGGMHWSKPLRLSRPERPTQLLTEAGFKGPGGDYMNLAEDGRGTAHAAWGVSAIWRGAGEVWHCAVRLTPEEQPRRRPETPE